MAVRNSPDPPVRDGTFHVAAGAPRPLDRALREALGGASWNHVRSLIRSGKVRLGTEVVLDPTRLARAEQVLELRLTAPRPVRGPRLRVEQLAHVDPDVLVVNKPAGLCTVPNEDSPDESLDALLRALVRRSGELSGRHQVLVVHRLDRDTSGLVLFARSRRAQQELKEQLREHEIRRTYLALVRGQPQIQTIRSRLVRDRGDGLRGSSDRPQAGRVAVTHLRPLQSLRGASLVECRLETGRTHQIRIHLAEIGHPVLGDGLYDRAARADARDARRQMLHAHRLAFSHPRDRRLIEVEAEVPRDFAELLARLRR